MHETKETNSDQTTTIQERTCRHQHTRCIVFGESVVRSSIKNNFRGCKQSHPTVVRLCICSCEFIHCSYKMNDTTVDLGYVLF